jgi:uncharacterized membrane protein YccC
MSLRHPELDPLVAEFKLRGRAIALLRRNKLSEADSAAWDGNLFLTGVVHRDDNSELLAALVSAQAEQQAAIAELAHRVRDSQNASAIREERAASKRLHGELSDDQLVAAIDRVGNLVDDATHQLKLLNHERQRRVANAKVKRFLRNLSPGFRDQLLSMAMTESQTKVHDPA